MSAESLLIRRRVSMVAKGALAAAVALSIALVVGWVPAEFAVMLRSRPSGGAGSDDDSPVDVSPPRDRRPADVGRAIAGRAVPGSSG